MMRIWLPIVLLIGSALPARAELVFFTSGRTLSVKAHSMEGDSLVLALRGGGELVCEASLVERITPDEVPYPEPAAAAAAVQLAPATAAARAPLQADPRFDPMIKK